MSQRVKCALERKIPILIPEWVDECYQIWLRGDDVDLQGVRALCDFLREQLTDNETEHRETSSAYLPKRCRMPLWNC